MMNRHLCFFAGKNAYIRIKEAGLQPEMIKVIAGAAGGPKWLVLNHLDRAVFHHWIGERTAPLFMIGSSIAAWRFAAVCQDDPLDAFNRFETAYLKQSYSDRPTPREIADETRRIRDAFLDQAAIRSLINHPTMRLNFMAVRSRGLNASENKFVLGAGLIATALSNMVNRRLLSLFFERTLFYHPKTPPPFFESSEFPLQRVPLDEENLAPALLASGSIPLIISGVRGIRGAKSGTYRDGGVIDYHMDIPFQKANDDAIVLYPHYTRRIIPGWLDKKLSWRKPDPRRMAPVLLVAPSDAFAASLPYGKIPDRTDFWTFAGRDKDRIDYWRTVIQKSEALGNEFLEAVDSGKIRELVQPLPE